ncbi:putative inner membrane transporter YedA [Andreprevotia sp. IGB-42]|uniref:DMT family transporter n=1 Tax=Andreprevotia sp. IGB-42 TaxID=2497473 RepID=UPI00135846BF|nr:EamA family transporter [Andreprevotia sp. IGB-42]KAF0814806.1 putative inner membrane transporter YedA [Andreprevotia sp. IGB-42]
MKKLLAALVLIGVWSTTALAINWSVHGLPVQLALFGRFGTAALACWLLLRITGRTLPMHAGARRAYLVGGLGTSLSMACTYWASHSVSSGTVAVLFGLIPFSTALFTHLWLHEKPALRELVGVALGVAGLGVIFAHGFGGAALGLLVVLVAVMLQSATAVRLKIDSQGLSALAVNTGALLVCAALTGLAWLLAGMPLPAVAPMRALGAVAYLAIIGSALGFSVYYWMIRECRPAQVALLSLASPAAALWLGHALNAETVTAQIVAGTALILAGLVVHQMAPRKMVPD